MTLETIFYTQITSVIAFIFVVFGVYRLLVQQKDATIEQLKERLAYLETKVKDFEKQSPDVMVESLHRRVEIAKAEILRLKDEGEEYKGQVTGKEEELHGLKFKLEKLAALLADSDLVCPDCGAPLVTRNYYTIYGPGDQDADVEYSEYECGYVCDEGNERGNRPCGARETIEGQRQFGSDQANSTI